MCASAAAAVTYINGHINMQLHHALPEHVKKNSSSLATCKTNSFLIFMQTGEHYNVITSPAVSSLLLHIQQLLNEDARTALDLLVLLLFILNQCSCVLCYLLAFTAIAAQLHFLCVAILTLPDLFFSSPTLI